MLDMFPIGRPTLSLTNRVGILIRMTSSARNAVLAVGVLLLGLVLITYGTFAYLRHSVDARIHHLSVKVDDPPLRASPAPQNSMLERARNALPLNFLILGSDAHFHGSDPRDWHEGAQRSDVIMLLQLNGDRSGASVLSLPGDLLVSLPGEGDSPLNAVYPRGGADLLIQTVRHLMNIPIHHFAVIDFESLSEVTDVIGGVDISTSAGERHFDGAQAMRFVREHPDSTQAEIASVCRQQVWIRSILGNIMERNLLADPHQLGQIVEAFLAHSAFDQGLTFDSLLALALESHQLRSRHIAFLTAPIDGPSVGPHGEPVLLPHAKALAGLAQAWSQDRVEEYVASSGDIQLLDAVPVR